MKKFLHNKFLLIFSMLESFWLIYGNLLSKNKSIKNFDFNCVVFFIIGTIIIFMLNIFIKKIIDKKRNSNIDYNFSWKKVILYFAIIIILWIPVLLAYYPGIWGYDVASQLPHITDKYSSFRHISSQHPITHTLYLELFVMIGKHLGNYVLGILLATIVQMVIVAFSLSFCIEKVRTYINNKNINIAFTIISILFYGLMPFSSIMAISATKDVLFSSFFIISLIHLYDLLYNKQNTNKKMIYFFIFSLLTILFKNNYFIIFILMFIILIVYFKRDVFKQKYFIKYGLCIILLFYLINFTYNIILRPEKTDIWEGMPVQVNTICHTVEKHPELVEEYTKDGILFNALDVDFIPTDYCFNSLADPMKSFFMENTMDNFSILKFSSSWIEIGSKYPAEYFDALSNLNRGAWYLFDESYTDIYPGKDQANGYLSTLYIPNLTDSKPDSKFNWLYYKMESILTYNIHLDNIFFKIILSPCLYILIILYFFFINLDKKDKNKIILFIPIICLYISILTGPCIIIRYIYQFMLLVPLLVGIYLKESKKENA